MQDSFIVLFTPLEEYIADLQVDNSTQVISGIREPSRSFKGLMELFRKQKDIFKKDFEPFLIKEFASQIEISIIEFEDFIINNLSELPTEAKRHGAEVREAKNVILKARLNKCFDIIGVCCCIACCPVNLCSAFCYSILDAMCDQGNSIQRDRDNIPYVLFSPCSIIEKLGRDYEKQNRKIDEAGPRVQRMV